MIDRQSIVQKTHNVAYRLTAADPIYKQWIFRYTFLELEKDLGSLGDITTRACFPKTKKIKAKIIAKQDGVLAGIQEIEYFLSAKSSAFAPRLGKISVKKLKDDGAFVKSNQCILELTGEIYDICAIERIVLNLISRMSGVATLVFKWFQILQKLSSPILLAPTRKTLWGLLDKRACVLGGGGTHRLGLSDAILIKDTHISAQNNDVELLLKHAFLNMPKQARFFEIEVDTKRDALTAGHVITEHQSKIRGPFYPFILFDNMEPDFISGIISEFKTKGWYDSILFEASGGIRESNLKNYAKTGVDVVSSGFITNSAPAFDCSLEI